MVLAGLVGVRDVREVRDALFTSLRVSTTTEQERTHAHSIASNAQELPPRSPRKASRKPGRAARSVLGWNDSTGVLIRDISMLTSRERGELTGIMPSGRLHHTYSTPHTG